MEVEQSHESVSDSLIITLFQVALSRPAGDRDAYLEAACAHDPLLLNEVRRRVEWERRLGGFLLTPVAPFDRIDRPFAPGDAILRDRFRILRLAGEGGMGVVYEAFDDRLGHRIAIKCPRYEFRQRLSPEALKGLQVTHPHVCRVFEMHTEETSTGDVDFLTMEFLEGETLAARLERGVPKRWLESVDGQQIARQVCEGLGAIHARGIVHRDLKPANVMLSKDSEGKPRAVIMDFGIAQGADLFSSAARGSVDYLAPELWRGEAATVQSDIYALGVLLYEMACGHRPFPEEASWPERLRTCPKAPPVVSKTVLRCLEPDPTRRIAQVADLQRALFGRRWVLRATLGASACVAAGAAWQWPAAPVRLAILPPAIAPGMDAGGVALVNGFVSDLSYRLKALRDARRSFTVDNFGASHTLSFGLANRAGGWAFSVSLSEGSRTLRQWKCNSAPGAGALAGQLFHLQSAIGVDTIEELGLRTQAKRQTLTSAAYADYLQGLYYSRLDYENAQKAIPYFERVVVAAPNSGLGYAGLAEALVNARYVLTRDKTLPGRAQAALTAAEQREPDLPQVYLISGKLNAARWPERALTDFRRAAELDQRDPEAFLEIGRLLSEQGRAMEATAAFQAALAVQPGYYKAHLMLGSHYFRMRNYAEAERYWLESARLGPLQTRARLNLVTLYLLAGRLGEVQRQLDEVFKVKKTRAALEALGSLRGLEKRYVEAVAAYEEAIAMGPNFYKSWEGLGGAYRRAGRLAYAQRTYRTGLADTELGLDENPADAERVAWCAYYHAALGEAQLARARAAEAIRLQTPLSHEVRERLVFAFDEIHDSAAALQLMEGTPAEFMKGLVRSGELSDALRRSPQFERLIR